MIEIVLAGVPRGKQRVRRADDGHAYTPERTVSFEGRLAYAAQCAMGGRPLLDGQLVADIVVLVPIPKSRPEAWKVQARAGIIRPTSKPDFDNYAKMVDALNMIVWVDDALIVRGEIDKFYSDRPLFAIRVRAAHEKDRKIPAWVDAALKASTPHGVFE